MGHWAKVVTSHIGIGTSAEDNKVVKVIVADASFFDTYSDPDGPARWVETKKGMAGGILWNPDGDIRWFIRLIRIKKQIHESN